VLVDTSIPPISLCVLLASGLLVGGGALTLADATSWLPDGTGAVGIVAVAVAHLLFTVRLFRAMAGRETRAFEHGKEYARVHPLR
jgi:hypothetical protein